jgi:hypothetical protein
MRESRFPYALEAKHCATLCMRARPWHRDGAYPLSRGVMTGTGRRLLPN